MFLSAAQTSQHEREGTQVTGTEKERWRGAHTREGFCPRPEAVMLKEKPKPKPNHTTPFPQTPAELVRYAWEVLIRTRRKTKKEQHRW